VSLTDVRINKRRRKHCYQDGAADVKYMVVETVISTFYIQVLNCPFHNNSFEQCTINLEKGTDGISYNVL
jgi:hypothetical protein